MNPPLVTGHGLIVGRFHPPHSGHHVLVRAAARACVRLTLAVRTSPADRWPGAARVQWLREAHADTPQLTVVAVEDEPAQGHCASRQPAEASVRRLEQALGRLALPPVTAVFGSDASVAGWASRLRAHAIVADPAHQLVPVCSAALQADLAGHWQHLAEPVRGALSLKVVGIGSESTGTTTLTLGLADALRRRGAAHGLTRWVGEYGRDYSVQKLADARAQALLQGLEPRAYENLPWAASEFEHIAREQIAWVQREARMGGPAMICDTDALATAVWEERYTGVTTPAVEQLALQSLGDLYLVTHHADVPFEADSIRDGEHLRAWMTGRFIERLEQLALPFVVLRGSPDTRLQQALAAVDRELAARGLTPPAAE